jgi:hypothetical protein
MALINYNNDFLLDLAYLMGEKSVVTSTSASRTNFIQNALTEAYRAYPWRFARANATLTLASGLATLPADYDDNHPVYFKFNNGTDVELDLVDADDNDELQDGDRAAWIEAIGDGSRYVVKTKDSDVSIVLARYQTIPPVLSTASVGTPYPNKRTISFGARRDVKLGQNPDADISQDQALFEQAIAKDIAAHQVPAPRKRRRTAQRQANTYTGYF